MIIDKALRHFEWKFKNVWKATEKDIEAYNAIIDYVELTRSENLCQNELLAKLWIYQFISFMWASEKGSKVGVKHIDSICRTSVFEWCNVLKTNLNQLYAMKNLNNDKKFVEALNKELSDEQIIKFVEKNISLLLEKYEKQDLQSKIIKHIKK